MSDDARITVTSHGCVVLARADGVLKRRDVEVLTTAIDAQIEARTRFLVLANALAVTGVEPAARQFVGEHRKRHVGAVEPYDLGLVLAVRSPIVRGAITAISWFSGAFANLRMVESPGELVRVGRRVLSEAGVAVSPSIEEALEAFASRSA